MSAFLALRSMLEGALLLDLLAPTGAFRSRDENSAVPLAIVERGAPWTSSEDLELLKEGC